MIDYLTEGVKSFEGVEIFSGLFIAREVL